MKTYFTVYQNEVRVVELIIHDQNDAIFEPSAAFAQVINDADVTVLAETTATVSSNSISMTLNTTVTATPGTYEIIWRIVKTVSSVISTYYHKTQVVVEKL